MIKIANLGGRHWNIRDVPVETSEKYAYYAKKHNLKIAQVLKIAVEKLDDKDFQHKSNSDN